MYPKYNMYRNNQNMYMVRGNNQDNRFIGGGFVAPLLLGGVAGYALGNNNTFGNNNNYPTPMYFVPGYQYYPYNYPTYYSSNSNYYY